MKLQSGHLTEAEVQQFLGGAEETLEHQRIERHLSECSLCFQLALQAQRTQLGFTPLVSTADEDRFLNDLKTSSRQWQRDYVRRKIISPSPSWFTHFFQALSRFMPPRTWGWASAGTAVLVLGILTALEGPVIMDAFQLAQAKKLAITAASEQSTIKMRLPSSGYVPRRKVMSDGPQTITSPSLREAQSIVLKKKKVGALDRRWLQADGLTSLLDGTSEGPSKASISFEKALIDGLDDPSLEIELAASYFESDKPDVPRTIQLLEGVLSRSRLSDEEKKTAIYDLAIAYQSIEDWQDAAAKWEAYLSLDNSSQWAEEAKRGLNNAKSKLKILRSKPPSPDPSSFLEQPSLQSRVEEYQEIALESWLPQAVREPDSEAGQASRMLAELLAKNHSDLFLKNMLSASSPEQAQALEALKSALRKNKTGPYLEAGKDAAKAASLFARHHNVPGELYARFEEIFAAQQALDSDRCVALGRQLKHRLAATGYRWLMAQTALERAACLNQAEDYNTAIAELQSSEKIENNDFPVLGLRILGLKAGIHLLQNHYDESWQECVKGLRQVTETPYPWQRIYQFYSVLEQYAEKRHYLHAQRALLLQAIAIQEAAPREDESMILKGALYGRLSKLYLALKEDGNASEAAAKSNLLLSEAGQDETTDKYVVYIRTGLAEEQRRLGSPEMAARTLEPGIGLIARIKDKLLALDFYHVLGDSYRQSRRLEEAASIYESGIVLAEQMLSSVKDEPSRLKWIEGVDPVYRGLMLVLLEQGKTEEAFKMWEWYGGRTARIPDQAANWSWDGLQKKIFQPVDFSVTSTRLVYAAFEDRLQVWTTQADAIKGYSIKIKQADLEKQVNDFALQCATAPTYIYSMDELRKSGEPLSTLFLQPVHAELEASHNILVELDPRLARLPVEALMMPGGRYFGEEYSITISPGLFRENDLRPAPHVAPSWSVLVATGAPSRGPSHLEGWDDFGSGVREVFKNTAFASAEQDSWKTVSGRLRNSDVFIFVGHGVPQGTNTALEWGNLLLNAKAFPPETLQRLHFAVLAACSSGKGGQSPLMETGSLIHAFHAGGVPSILVTRWDVDPEATAALLKSFFIHLGQSEEIPSAMYHARNDFRRLLLSNVSYRHPYYWAGLELVSRVN